MNHDDPRTLTFLFEECVRRYSGHTALEFEGESLSYGELNRRANRLAHHLRDTGQVRPDDRVAILVRHPLDVIISMLAVLKAGGAYVPLDPDNPPGVTQRIVEDVAPKAMVIESSAAAGAMYFNGELFVLDVMSAALTTPDTDPEPAATPSDLAYVIYTSGSTGRPKGVAVEHRAIVHTLTWRNSYYGFGPEDVTLAIPRPSFDSAVADTFCALTSGARLLLPRRDRITDRHYLTGLMEHGNVTHFLITPMLYKRLLEGMEAGSVTSLRCVTIAGEWFTPSLTLEHYLRLPQVDLYNEYGPSENAVCSTVHRLAATDERVLIGRPIENTEAFVLDEDGQPVGPGGIGELHLAGAGLARGYLGDPELTAQRFFTPAAAPAAGKRVYRTGDIVRQHAGGDLEFIERRDGQVKIRGRRVELGQVAQVLAQDATVSHVHVLRHVTETDTPLLVAFVQGSTGQDVDRLRATAQENLPDYMVPSAIIPVDTVPLTGNGKVDDKALIALYEGTVGRRAAGPQPGSEAEAALLEIWQELFAPLPIGLDDDFLDLGGDSLSVMDLLAHVEQRIGVQLEVSDPYTDRTIRSLALVIEDRQNDKVGAK
ncbi:amino acid adenylation domain-containing protein [Streptomyces sp. NBC_00162]|uniref:amino acid adenylation domain-containing protein n=1 Tax=Streptomyces sp. NBC_00162 TaxID=2903629 RepID=UPI00214BCE3B|nr:amino acid adenylation domain-containing protein [Streptomyces sp. NBC_00162]UUU43327.1 amino acid adenylation domain-containing protein [Streptomyces sp. NBC_00162]